MIKPVIFVLVPVYLHFEIMVEALVKLHDGILRIKQPVVA
jgi:hypothetical protein